MPLNVVEGGQASPQDTHMDRKAADDVNRLADVCGAANNEAVEIRIKGRSDEAEDDAVAECSEEVLQTPGRFSAPEDRREGRGLVG